MDTHWKGISDNIVTVNETWLIILHTKISKYQSYSCCLSLPNWVTF